MKNSQEIKFKVRYSETDAQGHVHHANYFNYFEQGRVELLREQGCNYRQLEEEGYFLVVAHLECDYKATASFDDDLVLTTTLENSSRVKLEHSYSLKRGDEVVALAKSVIVCIDKEGNVKRLPKDLFN